MMIVENRRSKAHFDLILCILVYAMAIFGVLAVTNATYSINGNADSSLLNQIISSDSGTRQTVFLFVSPIVLGVLVSFRYDNLKALSRFVYYASVFLLVVALVTSQSSNVKAWMDLFWGYTLQPAEFAKIGMMMMLAKVLAREETPMNTPKGFMRVMGILLIPGSIIMAQGEFGSFLAMAFIFVVMLYFGGVPLKVLIGMAAVAVVGVLAIYGFSVASGVDSYRINRILAFIDPEAYSQGDSYQMLQSQMSIGSGGLHGKGMFVDGSVAQLNYVPEDQTDFIYATIGEAFGFVGCVGVLVVYLLIVLRLFYLARFTKDKYGRLVIFGVMGMFLFHVFQNVAMSIGLMPITGIPLPFLSYGGSNMITNMGGIGLVLNIVKNRSLAAPVQAPQVNLRKYGTYRRA